MRSVLAVVASVALLQSASALPTFEKRGDAKPKGELNAKYAVTDQTRCFFDQQACNPQFDPYSYYNQVPNSWSPYPYNQYPPSNPWQYGYQPSSYPFIYGPSNWPNVYGPATQTYQPTTLPNWGYDAPAVSLKGVKDNKTNDTTK